jgi:hypothetical protein
MNYTGCIRKDFPIAVVDFDVLVTGNSRPSTDGRDWQLYADECGRMKFDNLPIADIRFKFLCDD